MSPARSIHPGRALPLVAVAMLGLLVAACSGGTTATGDAGGAASSPSAAPASQPASMEPSMAPSPSAAASPSAMADVTVDVTESADLGSFLVDAEGVTLYLFTQDTAGSGESACYDQCATNWPPLTVEAGATPTGSAAVTGELGTITRTDGSLQVTYEGQPLYYFAADAAPGDTNGQGVNDVWFVVEP